MVNRKLRKANSILIHVKGDGNPSIQTDEVDIEYQAQIQRWHLADEYIEIIEIRTKHPVGQPSNQRCNLSMSTDLTFYIQSD